MKDLIKSSTIYILLGFLPTAVNFIMVPLLTTYLTKEEYGLLSISALFQGIIAIFLNIGLDAAFARYYFNVYKKRKLLHAYYSTVLLTVLGFSILLFGLLLILGDPFLEFVFKNNRYHFSDYGVITFVLSLATILHTIILSYYRNEENLKMYSLFSIITLAFTVTGILIGVVWFNKGAYGNILGRSIAFSGIVLLYLVWYFHMRLIAVYKNPIVRAYNRGINSCRKLYWYKYRARGEGRTVRRLSGGVEKSERTVYTKIDRRVRVLFTL